MTLPSQTGSIEDNSNVNRCQRLAMQLTADLINFQEFAYNMTLTVIDAPDVYMEHCLAEIPSSIASQYMEYLRNLLEPVDFMPCARPFLVDTGSDERIDQKQRQLRPKYIRLLQLMKKKVV